MRSNKLVVFVLFTIVITSLIFQVSAQVPPPGPPGGPAADNNKIQKQILDIPGKQEGPLSVYGRYTVYMQDGNVWLHDAGDLFKQDDDQGPVQITKDGQGNKYTFPVIDRGNGRQVAWLDNNKDIFVYDIKTKETKKLNLIEAFDVEQKEFLDPRAAAEQSVVVSDGAGGAIVAWLSWDGKGLASFVDAQGNVKNKIEFSQDTDELISISSDGKGGAIVGWTQDEARIMARFIDAQGSLGNPIIISDLDGNEKILTSLISDNKGGAIATWLSGNGIFVTFIDAQGNVKNINIPNTVSGIPNIAPDGNGGAILTWVSEQERKMFALFIDAQGNLGNPIFIDDTGDIDEFLPAITSDGNGGAIIGYLVNDPQGTYIFVKFLKSDGSVGNAIKILPQSGVTFWSFPVLASDGQGGAILAFGSGVNGAGLYTVLIDSQGNLGDFVLVTQRGGKLFLSIDRNGQNGYLLTWISGDLFLDFLDLKGNSINRVNVEPLITGGERVIKTISRNFMPESKENLYFYNGKLAWDQHDNKWAGRDVRGYDLNEPGEPNGLDAQDKHYFFLTDLEAQKVGNEEVSLNEIKPVLSGDSIFFIGDVIHDFTGDNLGYEVSQELYTLENFLSFEIFTPHIQNYRTLSAEDDGCNVKEVSAERESANPIWIESCTGTFKIRRDLQQPLATSDTSTFHSPLLKVNDYFYIEKSGNDFLLRSSSQLGNNIIFRINTGEKMTISLGGMDHEIEFTEVIDANTEHFRLKFDGTEFELVGTDKVRLGNFEIGRDGQATIGCGGGPGGVSCNIQLKVEELYFVSEKSMDLDKSRLVYLKDNIETLTFQDVIQSLGQTNAMKSIPFKDGSVIVWTLQGQDNGLRINFIDSQGNFKFKEPKIIPFNNWINNIKIASQSNGIFAGDDVFILFQSNRALYVLIIDSNGNVKLEPKLVFDGDKFNLDPQNIILIGDGHGGAVVAFIAWANNFNSIYALTVKSDGRAIGPITITKGVQLNWESISLGSYGDGGAMVSWIENERQFGFGVAKYVFIDAQGNLKDFSGGKFPALDVTQPVIGGKFIRGDANKDGFVDVSDAVFILNYLFLGGEKPSCLDAADADDSGILDLSDPIYLLSSLFSGGTAVPPPNTLGEDPTDDKLNCGEQKARNRLFFR